ncbi:hypothetical protein Rhopal_006969-T1 [Rhodotorula paludigena]|uniref:Pre-rRNA-processing protein IPI3 n=1 Tax=Rhodotorula paludigena TaxID=86838 RepID=A0AAV5GVF0_9BASI|nr:hypothetical protein Rhopal_006969-T1 [Rhodotorula paludigena]
MQSTAPLSELVLSSTHSASPLPTVSLHDPVSGALVYSFRSPVAASTVQSSGGRGRDGEDKPSLEYRRTFEAVEASNGCGGFLMGLGGKDGRAAINVWSYTRETTQQRLIPPVRLSTFALSCDGVYMAGGTLDGRIFLWEVSSGTLLVTVDAHYRSISALKFSDDGAALVSGSEDAGVSVWSIGRLLNATPMNPPAPYATLSDHTLPITDICVGLGSFPHCRVMTSSMDSTVKIWDISTSPASLLSTFSFPHPVSHIAWDTLERFFFAAGPSPSSAPPSSTATAPSSSTTPAATDGPAKSRVVRVNLFRKRKDEFGIDVSEQVGGGGRGEVERVGEDSGKEGESYEISDTITSLHLSSHSPLLLLGTLTSQVHLVSLPSLLASRILSPPPSSTSPGAITSLSTLLRPLELGASSAHGGSGGALELPSRTLFGGGTSGMGLGRTVVPPSERERGGPHSRVVDVRIAGGLGGGGGERIEDLIQPARGLASPAARLPCGGSAEGGAGGGLERERARANELQREVEALRMQLGRAVGVGEGLWKKVVEGVLEGR